MKPRITIIINKDGELEIWPNPDGRDLLVRELSHLSESSDHFHFGPENLGSEVPVQSVAHCNGDQVIEWGKVLFRPDEWDSQHFPQVIAVENQADR